MSSGNMAESGEPLSLSGGSATLAAAAKAAAEHDKEYAEKCGRWGRYDEELGRGSFKIVYKAFDEKLGVEVAWNQISVKAAIKSDDDYRRLMSEVKLLAELRHPSIVRFHDAWVDRERMHVNFITEIFNSGTLHQYRQKHRHCHIDAVKSWSRQILEGLLYLHTHVPPIIHRDLKTDNVFVNGSNGKVKIGDLGLATPVGSRGTKGSIQGTPEFMAPEMYDEVYDTKVDIYAFGMCVLEMVTYEYPYSECANVAQIYKKVLAGEKPEALSKVADPDVRRFIDRCLDHVQQRPDAAELLEDPFLKDSGSPDRGGGDWNRTSSTGGSVAGLPSPDTLRKIASLSDMGAEDGAAGMRKSASSAHMGVGVPNGPDDEGGQVRGGASRHATTLRGPLPPPAPRRVGASVDASAGALGLTLPPGQPHQQPTGPVGGSLARAPSLGEALGQYAGKPLSTGEYDFRVKAALEKDSVLMMKLRMTDWEGHVKTIAFHFDFGKDTPASVAAEMAAELNLSASDAAAVERQITNEATRCAADTAAGGGVLAPGHGLPSQGLSSLAVPPSSAAAAAGGAASPGPPRGLEPLPEHRSFKEGTPEAEALRAARAAAGPRPVGQSLRPGAGSQSMGDLRGAEDGTPPSYPGPMHPVASTGHLGESAYPAYPPDAPASPSPASSRGASMHGAGAYAALSGLGGSEHGGGAARAALLGRGAAPLTPGSSHAAAMGAPTDYKSFHRSNTLLRRDSGQTHVNALPNTAKGTPLIIDAPDRQGLLMEIIGLIAEMRLNVVAAEILTDGEYAKDLITVTGKGEPLDEPTRQRVVATLQDQLVEKHKAWMAAEMDKSHPVAI